MDKAANYKIKRMSPQFLVADIDRSIEFYTEKLGFNIDFYYQDFYSGLMKDGCSIHLKAGKPFAHERENRRTNEDIDILFSVNNVEDLYKNLSNNAVNIIQPLREMDYGKEFYVEDPNGYIIAFLQDQTS